MIDARSHTTRSTRLRKTKKTKENISVQLSNGLNISNGEISHNHEKSELDRSWNIMNYSDYVDYRTDEGNVTEKSLIDALFGSSLFGFAWDILEDVQRRRSGSSSIETSVANTSYGEGGSKTPGFIFKYYKKFGYYWNVFPKTDYCYLPGSPDYHKEVSPGIPKVPNLSRYPLSSYIKRGIHVGRQDQHSTSHLSDSRLSFYDSSFKSSTRLENSSSSKTSNQNWASLETRQNIINKSLQRAEKKSSWLRVKRLTQTFLSVIKKTILMTFTTVSYVSSSLISSHERHKLPLLFLIFLLPFLYFLLPGYVQGSQDDEVTTAVNAHASNFLSWSSGSISSIFNLVKESLLYIPTIYWQLLALFTTGNSSTTRVSEAICPDTSSKDTSSQFPLLNLSKDLTEEKLLALQTEIVEKLKAELAGRNHDITARIQQLQDQMGQLTEDMKKMSIQFEGDWKTRFNKLKEELSGLKKDVIDAQNTAISNTASPSEKMVEKIVAKYHADRTGIPDYALQSSGGYIVRVRCAQTFTRRTAQFYMLGLPLPWDVFNGPETIIKPGVMPGECWAFEGSFAQVTLHLATKVKITGFSLEHSPTELSLHGNIMSAPKQFSVWALETENDENPVFLGRFNFLDNGQSLQQFDALVYDQFVDLIELKVESNHGHPEYTCIYRFRVHGVPPPLDDIGANSTGLAPNSGASPKEAHTKPYR